MLYGDLAGNKYMGLPDEYTKVRAIGQLASEFANALKPWAKGDPEAPADPDGVISKCVAPIQHRLL